MKPVKQNQLNSPPEKQKRGKRVLLVNTTTKCFHQNQINVWNLDIKTYTFLCFSVPEQCFLNPLGWKKQNSPWVRFGVVLHATVLCQVPVKQSANTGWCSEAEVSLVPASSGDSSRFGVCQFPQVNERQMCDDSTVLIRLNQCHTVTSG